MGEGMGGMMTGEVTTEYGWDLGDPGEGAGG